MGVQGRGIRGWGGKEYALRILILQTVVSQGKQNICARICPHAYAPQRFAMTYSFLRNFQVARKSKTYRPNENEISHSRVSGGKQVGLISW